MLYKLVVNLGFLALGYYIGREVGRTEEVRERLAHARSTGETINMRDAVSVDKEQGTRPSGSGSVKH